MMRAQQFAWSISEFYITAIIYHGKCHSYQIMFFLTKWPFALKNLEIIVDIPYYVWKTE